MLAIIRIMISISRLMKELNEMTGMTKAIKIAYSGNCGMRVRILGWEAKAIPLSGHF